MTKHKLINEKTNKGVWVHTTHLIDLMKICFDRNKYYFEKLKDWYEYLEDEKFEMDLIKKENYKK